MARPFVLLSLNILSNCFFFQFSFQICHLHSLVCVAYVVTVMFACNSWHILSSTNNPQIVRVKFGEKIHSLLIFVYSLNSFSIHIEVVCSQKRLQIIYISFSCKSIILYISRISSCHTLLNVFV